MMNPDLSSTSRGTYGYRFHYLCMRVPVSYIDRKLAQLAASYSYEPFEKCLQFLTAIGDEKILGSASLAAWIIAGLQDTKPNKYRHLLITVIVITVIDHLSKHVFDQRRPDRGRQANTIPFLLVIHCALVRPREPC